MENEIVTIKNEMTIWNEEKWKRVMELFVPKGVNQKDAIIFLELAKSYQLNPFKKEIWVIPYGDKCNVFCGRDGFLSIAHRSGNFDGMETVFGYDKNNNLEWAECIVYNKTLTYPIKCKVFLKEYTTNQNLWKTKPHVMLQKVAESTALRRSFNINGLYSPEEISEINEPPIKNLSNTIKKPQTKAQETKAPETKVQEEKQEEKKIAGEKAMVAVHIDFKDNEGRQAVKDAGFTWNKIDKIWNKEVTSQEFETLSKIFNLEVIV